MRISKQDILEMFKDINYEYNDSTRFTVLKNMLNEMCEDCDRVEVVRCGECKWYKESELLAPNKFCFRLKGCNGKSIGYNFDKNDFCSYGEKMGVQE